MPRVKGGTVTRKRRKKIIKLSKGYYGSNLWGWHRLVSSGATECVGRYRL